VRHFGFAARRSQTGLGHRTEEVVRQFVSGTPSPEPGVQGRDIVFELDKDGHHIRTRLR